ncbi:MAG: thioredoxin domain-containing protein, partial [Candidatus Diapherotrites archaeon]|nr:thioredoxin domain-containing protein [Candidatus Diapherotrites archaeon]
MVICIIAFAIFAILGIFSAKYRELAKESFGCVFSTITLRPCTTGFDNKLKTRISVSFAKFNPAIGGFLYKNFKTLSLVFTILMIASLGYSIYSVYNLVAFGNCNGPQGGFCAFQPETYNELFFWENRADKITQILPNYENRISFSEAKVEVVEVGCFTCPFTRKAETYVKQMLSDYNGKINFSFHYFPLPSHPYSFELAEAAECAREQGKFWEVHDALFITGEKCSETTTIDLNKELGYIVDNLGLDKEKFNSCVAEHKYKDNVQKQKDESIHAGIYGTPTFFINGKVLVSPKNYEELKTVID